MKQANFNKLNLASKERVEFSERLINSLLKSDIHLRVIEIQKIFLNHSSSIQISTHGIRKWLFGESIPTQDKLRVLADILSVDINWLRYGISEKNIENSKLMNLNSNQKNLLNGFDKLSSNQKKYIIEITDALATQADKN